MSEKSNDLSDLFHLKIEQICLKSIDQFLSECILSVDMLRKFLF